MIRGEDVEKLQNSSINKQFAMDVSKGLLKENKYLLSKYLYDEKGSELFNRITRHPDYYLTQCEMEILDKNKCLLSKLLENENFNLIELGPGEGIKARVIIDQFLHDSREFTYFTIDISRKYLSQIERKFHKDLPDLKLQVINRDYINGLEWLNAHSENRNIVLFLGSSIGNFDKENMKDFLNKVWTDLRAGDYFLIGFDLKKNIDTMIQAYNDRDGITREFNLNLLRRMNRELKTDFEIASFEHYETYNVLSGAMESYLVSLKEQNVHSETLHQTFHFDEYEPVHIESSYKYIRSQIEKLAQDAGFEVVNNFSDSRDYFIDSLWRVCK